MQVNWFVLILCLCLCLLSHCKETLKADAGKLASAYSVFVLVLTLTVTDTGGHQDHASVHVFVEEKAKETLKADADELVCAFSVDSKSLLMWL